MKRLLKIAIFALGITIGTTAAYAAPCKVYAFGDSLSDIGDLSDYSAYTQSAGVEPPSPPYDEGRFSNGPVWVETLAATLCPGNSLTSFARGGAFSDNRNANADIGVFGGLRDQVAESSAHVTIKPDDYVLVWAGANNYVFDTVAASPAIVVDDIKTAIEDLAAQGARKILVLNMPALGNTPFAQYAAATGAAFPAFPMVLNEKAALHNQLLQQAVRQMAAATDAQITLLDVASLFTAILTGQLGNFQNTTDPCLIQDEERNRTATGLCAGPGLGDGLDPNLVVFFDLLHPTEAVHQLIAANAMGALDAAASAQVASAP